MENPRGRSILKSKKKVLGNEERMACRPADLLELSFERIKQEVGDLAKCEEDVLTYALFPTTGREFLTKKYSTPK